jgi:hypothetical protein
VMIPVIYIHFGDIPEYLFTSIEQAAIHNREIILLSDKKIIHNKIKNFLIEDYSDGVDDFCSVYRHMSTNTPEFEMICMKRWFVLRNFMNRNETGVCYYSDSDVMIYDDLNNVYNNYNQYDAAYTLPESQENYRWTASACCSYWKKNTLNKFCEFIMESYVHGNGMLDEKWTYHVRNNIMGGICDMTFLYLFSNVINFFSLSKTIDDFCFDRNMLVSENYFRNEYDMMHGVENREHKRIAWRNGKPVGRNLIYNKSVRFIALTEYAKLVGNEKSGFQSIADKINSILKKTKNV